MRWLLFLLLAVCQLSAVPPVLVMSLDGLAAEQFTPATLPRLWALGQRGLRGRGLPPFPSTTFNGHATLSTGCWPEHHGIVANGLVDPARGFVANTARADLLEAEPLWVAATRAGRRTSLVGWPFADVPWQGQSTWRQLPFRMPWSDDVALEASAAALRDGAELVMTYLTGTDEEAHRHGPSSPEVRAKLARIDAQLAPWLESQLAAHPGLRVWLVADHGSLAVPRRLCLPEVLGDIPARIIAHGGSATLHLARFGDLLEARRRLRAAGLKAWTRSEIPESFHLKRNPRCGDLVALAPPGTWLAQHRSGPEADKERVGRQGAHAFEPTLPAMHTWLVVLGAGQGNLGQVPLWDVAPSVAHQLGIPWSLPRDGRVLPRLR